MAYTTPPSAGSRLRASVLAAIAEELQDITARTTGDQNLTASSTTLQNVTELVVTPDIGQFYRITLNVLATLSSGTTEDIKFAVTFPAGATCVLVGIAGGTAGGVTAQVSTDMNIAGGALTSGTAFQAFGLSTSTVSITIMFTLFMSSTAGNFQVQAAQNTSGVNVVTVKTGSVLSARQAL